jgi:hypothetical protein
MHIMNQSVQYSTGVSWLHGSLESHRESWEKLDAAMKSFKAKPLALFEDKRHDLYAKMRKSNLDHSDDDLWTTVNEIFESEYSYEFQFHQTFVYKARQEFIEVALISHALCESLINEILALGLHRTGRKQGFALIEKCSVKDKWLSGPQLFAPEYKLEKGSATFSNFVALCRIRNEFSHQKITIYDTSEKEYVGDTLGRLDLKQDMRLAKKFLDVPHGLVENFRNTPNIKDCGPWFGLLSKHLPIRV